MIDNKRDIGLDFLRCMAILSVLLLHSTEISHHMPPFIKYLFSFGWIGVDIFFVLSGFLIGSQSLRPIRVYENKKSIYIFWCKRWFRTIPLYLFVLFFYIFLKPLITGTQFKPLILPFFLFLQNYFPLSDFVQSWSICIEEQFYLILPILTFFLFRKFSKKPLFWILIYFLGFIIRSINIAKLNNSASPVEIDFYIRFPLYTHFDGLVMGVFLASTKEYWSRWASINKVTSGVLAIFALLTICYSFGPQLTAHNVNAYFTLLPIIFSLLLVAFKDLVFDPFLGSLVRWIALLSYGAYLWNNLLIRFFARYLLEIQWHYSLFLFLLATHILALFTYFLVERPFLNLREKYIKSIT